MSHSSLYIDNNWLLGMGDEFISTNPATNEVIWQGRGPDSQQIEETVLSARNAFNYWSLLPVQARINIIKEFQELVSKNSNELAVIIAQETGKPLWEAKTEVAAMIGKIDISIRSYFDRTGAHFSEANGITSSVNHKPHGVVVVIGPYNFPAHLPNGHIIPALIAGNSVIFKPSEQTPLTAQFITSLWQKSGLPPGVFSLLQGSKQTSEGIVNHIQIDGIFFTGSSATGKKLHQQLSGSPQKILALEMGGNNPLVVSETENIKAALFTIIQSAFITSGQRCTCARRLIIPNNAFGDQLIAELIRAIRNIKIGYYDEDVFIGTVISSSCAENIVSAYDALNQLGGQEILRPTLKEASTAFITPSLIDMSSCESPPDDEYFGPLLQIYRYDTFEEAIKLGNNTSYGLSAGLISEHIYQFEQFNRQIRAGIVNWNTPLTGASSNAPFGGIGNSGNHRASAYYAADYCSYPVASMQQPKLKLPKVFPAGLTL